LELSNDTQRIRDHASPKAGLDDGAQTEFAFAAALACSNDQHNAIADMLAT
jgi:hypothetical protein